MEIGKLKLGNGVAKQNPSTAGRRSRSRAQEKAGRSGRDDNYCLALMSELKSLCGNWGWTAGLYWRAGGCAMPNSYEYYPEQVYLLPPSVLQVLGEEHLCFFVHRAAEKLDSREFCDRTNGVSTE